MEVLRFPVVEHWTRMNMEYVSCHFDGWMAFYSAVSGFSNHVVRTPFGTNLSGWHTNITTITPSLMQKKSLHGENTNPRCSWTCCCWRLPYLLQVNPRKLLRNHNLQSTSIKRLILDVDVDPFHVLYCHTVWICLDLWEVKYSIRKQINETNWTSVKHQGHAWRILWSYRGAKPPLLLIRETVAWNIWNHGNCIFTSTEFSWASCELQKKRGD